MFICFDATHERDTHTHTPHDENIKQQNIFITSSAVNIMHLLIISTAFEVMKTFLLFYMCHFAMGFTHCYET